MSRRAWLRIQLIAIAFVFGLFWDFFFIPPDPVELRFAESTIVLEHTTVIILIGLQLALAMVGVFIQEWFLSKSTFWTMVAQIPIVGAYYFAGLWALKNIGFWGLVAARNEVLDLFRIAPLFLLSPLICGLVILYIIYRFAYPKK